MIFFFQKKNQKNLKQNSNFIIFILLKFLYIIADWVVNLGRFGCLIFPNFENFLGFDFVTIFFHFFLLINQKDKFPVRNTCP
jgi:hypothetical protein